jgi:glycosyltransferase involved in cell wall biosynthesis
MQFISQAPHIALVGNHWFPKNPGGLDRYVYELAHGLTALQTEVDLYGIGLPHPSTSPMRLLNLAEPDQPLPQRLWLSYRHFAAKRDIYLDAINIHFALYGLPLLPHLPADVPITFTFHGPWAQESEREGSNPLNILFKRWLEQTVYRRCDRFIVLSKAFGQILHQSYGIPWEQIHVIPGGVDTQHFQANLTRQQAREQLDWPQDRFILFTPRRLVHRMGVDKLLTALAQIRTAIPDVWLAIAGKGSLRAALEQQVTELQLNQSVKFLGFLPDADLPVAYQAADLTMMPSQSLEGFGLVLLESLACGTPTLCTPIGGMPEVVSGLSAELITETADATAIAGSLKAIISGQINLPDRDTCRAYAVDQFNWTKIAQQIQTVLLK